MASKAGAITIAIFAVLAILLVCIGCGCTAYAGYCNVSGVSFNNVSARDSLPAMLGNAFWGWFIGPVSVIIIVLLGYLGYRVCKNAHVKVSGVGESGKSESSKEPEPEDQ